ncbi:hypothetical protein D3C85_1547490 [compost metagenome]
MIEKKAECYIPKCPNINSAFAKEPKLRKHDVFGKIGGNGSITGRKYGISDVVEVRSVFSHEKQYSIDHEQQKNNT